MGKGWGTICVGTRLEKMVDSQFVTDWSHLITTGLRPGDGFLISRDRVAHKSANALVRDFLETDHDSLLFIDSDAAFGPKVLDEIRNLDNGKEYDALQAFYTRRGWPPEAIWFTRNALGEAVQSYVFDTGTQDVIFVGLHFALFRREIFERSLEKRDPAIEADDFEWFFYERHKTAHEDTAYSKEVESMGFKMGATSHVRVGHITRVVTGWETYQQFLQISGQMDRINRHNHNIELVAKYLDEDKELVRARAMQGSKNVRAGITLHGIDNNADPAELRAFYGARDSGYFYDLLQWNSTPLYDLSVEPLEQYQGLSVLVVGAGLGGEVERLIGRNGVVIFELPGALRDFLTWRIKNDPTWQFRSGPAADVYQDPVDLREIVPYPAYDLIVAIDTLEHIHPEAFIGTLDAMDGLLKPGGLLYFRNNFIQQDLYPVHFNHEAIYYDWLEKNGYILHAGYGKTGVEIWKKDNGGNTDEVVG